ncbi:DUF262 domain-containing protein [Deinococcus oregonensis]|uniref:DUF262 domain-containing protein n=1 Tax=Deinococcus oregonensis TaxID=1805970 RepID=A0ABV6AZJ4_9DEIO
MQPARRALFALFEKQERYVIPLFQRPYVWSAENQWAPLWRDIQSRAEDELSRRAGHVQEVAPHFLGTVVVELKLTYGDQVRAFNVIDGQQRLTTFQVFFAAVRDLAKGIDEGAHREFTRITVNDCIRETEEEQYKVWPTHFDQAGFEQVMRSGNLSVLETWIDERLHASRPVPRVALAYGFFSREVRKWLLGEGEARLVTEQATFLRALLTAVRDHLHVVAIELDREDDPQVIFETINASGVPLLASDLVRNHVFNHAARQREDLPRLYQSYWAAFDDTTDVVGGFWKAEHTQGRVKREVLDLFLHHFLTFKLAEDVQLTSLFDAFKRWWKTTYGTGRAEDGLKELQEKSHAYWKLVEPDKATRLGLFVSRLAVLELTTLNPLLLFLMTDANLSAQQFDECMTFLESFVIRRLVVGYNSKAYNRLVLSLVRELRSLPTITPDALGELLTRQKGESGIWPSDALFKGAWHSTAAYRRLKSKGTIVVLEGVERALHSNRQESIQITGSLTVEHVLPQDWQPYWPLPGVMDAVTEASAREQLLHTFGNLTLLTQSLNSSSRHAAYHVKRQLITRQSVLLLNAYFQDVEQWNEAAIVQRSETLLEKALEVWPHPGVNTVPAILPQLDNVDSQMVVKEARHLLRALLPKTLELDSPVTRFRLQRILRRQARVSVHYELGTHPDDDDVRVCLHDEMDSRDKLKPFVTAAIRALLPQVEARFSEQFVRTRENDRLTSDTGHLNGIHVVFPSGSAPSVVAQAILALSELCEPYLLRALNSQLPEYRVDAAN